MRVVGLDPSLTSFGLATVVTSRTPPAVVRLYRVRPKMRGHERLQQLVNAVEAMTATADVVVIEGLSFGSKGSAVTDLAGLHWLVRHTLWKTGVPYAVVAHPTMAKWLTGKGNAGKDECLAAAIKRFPLADITGNDEADALTLAAMGCARYKRPLVQMPADRTVVLSAVEWPQLNRRTAA